MSVNLKEVKEFIIGWNEDNTEEFYKVADEIWENPELSMQEYKSSALLEDLLEKHGFQVERGVAGMPTAFIATYGSGRPVIGINAEYDALPGLSQDREKLEKFEKLLQAREQTRTEWLNAKIDEELGK